MILNWARQHPAMRAVKLDALVIAKMPVLEIDEAAGLAALATADTGPAILELTTPEAHALVVPFDVAASNWPFDVSFVLFLAGGINYLGEDAGAGGLARLVQPGAVLAERLPPGIADPRITTPDGGQVELKQGPDGRVVYGPIRKAGLYTLSWNGPPGPSDPVVGGRATRTFAANLMDAKESDVPMRERLTFASGQVRAQVTGDSKAAQKLWPWLVLAGLAVIMLEWFVYNRKVHV
jgi:hypothetical protein